VNNKKKDEMDKSQLQSHNPWWLRQELIQEDTKITEFEGQKFKWLPKVYFDFPLQKDAILTLRGPRQVGKTTFLKLLIRRLLLEENVPRETIFFYPCDRVRDYNQLFAIFNEYLNFVTPRLKNHIYIFLDEISFVKEWQRAIKDLADKGSLKNVTLLLTGSNILDIKFSSERLPGRRGEIFQPDITMLPLDFSEFLSLVNPELKRMNYREVFTLHFAELQKFFEDYLLTGGFLRNINYFYDEGFIPSFLYEMLISWIEGDLHKVGKSEETALRISGRLFQHLGTPFSYYKLARESGVISHLTTRDYLEILSKMFVLFEVPYLSVDEKRTDVKKNHKAYFYDPFILQTFLAKDEDFLDDAYNYLRRTFLKQDLRPKIAEMLVGAALKRNYPQLYYGMTASREIDFVVRSREKYSFFEVKYQRKVSAEDFPAREKISKDNRAMLISRDVLIEEGNTIIIPLEIFLGYRENFELRR